MEMTDNACAELLQKNVINYLTRSLNKINEPKYLLILDSVVNWKLLVLSQPFTIDAMAIPLWKTSASS